MISPACDCSCPGNRCFARRVNFKA